MVAWLEIFLFSTPEPPTPEPPTPAPLTPEPPAPPTRPLSSAPTWDFLGTLTSNDDAMRGSRWVSILLAWEF